MKLLKQILIILIIFFKTGNLLSENNLFNVNNISLTKKNSLSNNQLADKAIKEAFAQLSKKILLKRDIQKISELNNSDIRELVNYYNISNNSDNDNVIFNISFDKDKIHNLFYNRELLYSDIVNKEFYVLPILIKQSEINIFSNNYFYEYWNEFNDDLLEFILPLENIEIIQNINKSRSDFFNLSLDTIFKEYSDKNTALVFIEEDELNKGKIYLKAKIQGKFISKNLDIKKNVKENNSRKEVIFLIKREITNLVKSENLIDVRTPSFINVKLDLNKKNNLVFFKSKIKKINLIEEIFILELNQDYMNIKIKYFGKLERMINQLKKNNIILKLVKDEWLIKNL